MLRRGSPPARPGFYVLRLKPGALLLPALIYQLCPMVIPRLDGSGPEDWCRPLGRAPRYGALIDGQPAPIDRVVMARALRPVSAEEYAFRTGPLRDWTGVNLPRLTADAAVDLARLPPLY